MSLISILLGIVFFALLAKAIFETIYGSCLVIFGLACHAVAFLLDALSFVIRACEKIVRLCRKPAPEPVKFSIARGIALYYGSSK